MFGKMRKTTAKHTPHESDEQYKINFHCTSTLCLDHPQELPYFIYASCCQILALIITQLLWDPYTLATIISSDKSQVPSSQRIRYQSSKNPTQNDASN
jgi:hypothetical protein